MTSDGEAWASRRSRVWITRPSLLARAATFTGSVVLMVLALGMLATGGAGLLLGPLLALGAGLLLSHVFRQGVWLSPGTITLHYVASEHRLPVARTHAVAIGPSMFSIGVLCDGRWYVISDRSGASDERIARDRAHIKSLGPRLPVILEPQDVREYLELTRSAGGNHTVVSIVRAATRPGVIAVLAAYVLFAVFAVFATR